MVTTRFVQPALDHHWHDTRCWACGSVEGLADPPFGIVDNQFGGSHWYCIPCCTTEGLTWR